VPVTPFDAGATTGVGSATTATVVALLEAVAVGFFVTVVFVATGVTESVAVTTAAGAEAPIAGPPRAKGSVDANWGGVIAMTAPRPPKVPPAINNARFISYPHPGNHLKDLHCLYKPTYLRSFWEQR
jgi:hypothetical protein